MGILDGLEKFGLDTGGLSNLFEEEKEKEEAAEVKEVETDSTPPAEEEYLLEKKVKCTVCDRQFRELAVKSSMMRRMTPDRDLRPRFKGVDTLKYDINSCPYCGYTAMSRYFTHISTMQIRMINEQVCSKFTPTTIPTESTYTYATAVDRYKLALFNAMVKKAKVSEKAYICLKISWLLRGWGEEISSGQNLEDKPKFAKIKADERQYYEQAYEGLTKAVSSEDFPICGMDSNTMDLLLAAMSFNLGKYDMASRMISRILTSRTANRNSKDRAMDMKDEILEILKNNKQQ